ncbi:GNAT family N-acetyltransferase [Kitasatospora sp. NPDC093550]|uniref:GNAT family N-acetyltransferase n=1 Tax=Kitasatospora sp. NPDC093550 TaxID=3364089 RepID=UPI00380B6CBB
MSDYYLSGERVALGPMKAELIPEYLRWANDIGAMRGFGRQLPESLEARTKGFEVNAHSDITIKFTVHHRQTGEPVGITTLILDQPVKTAEFLILLAPEAKGLGLAAEATRLTMDYGFHISGVRMIHLTVLAPNTAAIRAYRKAGFQDAGRVRQAGFWNGQPCDELVMDALPHDLKGLSLIAT